MHSIFATKGDVLLMGSSGTGGLEAAVTNMFGPGDTLLACPTARSRRGRIKIVRPIGVHAHVAVLLEQLANLRALRFL
jgi:aspartate aminotransferase-like enzyme